MDTKALKNKILQLAIQGKLVPQDEKDEQSSVLLERIREEKEQLIKDKVIKKEKPLPEISEEEKLFELPNGWEWCRLGEIANIIMGQSPDSTSVSENKGGIEFHQGKASFGKILIKNSGLYCTKPNKVAISGDILLSVRAPVGTLNITNRELCIGRGLSAIRSFLDIENKFFYYFIMALEEELVSKATGTTFLAVSSTIIKELLIPLPPLEEQKRIVAKVDILFKLIDELDKNKQDLLQNISDSRNKILQLAIQGKLVSQDENDEPASVLLEKIKEEKEQLIKDKVIKKEKPLPEISEDEKIFELPNGWEWCRLGELGICQTGTTPSTTVEEYFGGDIPFIKPADISSKGIDYDNDSLTNLGMEKGRKIYENSLVMVCIGGSIGKNYFTDRICSCNQQINALTPLQNIDSRLLHYICSSQFFYNNLIQTATGTATPIIKKSNWEQLVIPIPPLEEQKRIVSKIDAIMNYLDMIEKQLN